MRTLLALLFLLLTFSIGINVLQAFEYQSSRVRYVSELESILQNKREEKPAIEARLVAYRLDLREDKLISTFHIIANSPETITTMKIWTDKEYYEELPFSEFFELTEDQLSSFVFVQLIDKNYNTSPILIDTIHPSGPPTVF